MTTTRSSTMRQLAVCGLAMGLTATCAGPLAAETGKTLEVKLGQTIQRTWDDVKKAAYAYGPKQEFDPSSQETHVWLPYGNKGEYFETAGVKFTDPGLPNGLALWCVTVNSNTSGRLVFKLHFDKPIGGFRFSAGWSEWGVGGDTVGGVEYSVDGRKWTTIRQLNEAKAQARIIDQFVDGKKTFSGLNTQDPVHPLLQPRQEPSGCPVRSGPLDEVPHGGRPGLGRRGHDVLQLPVPALGNAAHGRDDRRKSQRFSQLDRRLHAYPARRGQSRQGRGVPDLHRHPRHPR